MIFKYSKRFRFAPSFNNKLLESVVYFAEPIKTGL